MSSTADASKNSKSARVLHIITGLNQGGAEQQLVTLLKSDSAKHGVFSIKAPGPVASAIKEAGIPVFTGDASSFFSVSWLKKLRRTIKAHEPDLILGWMYHGNLATLVAKFSGFKGRIFWNVRHSVSDLRHEKLTTRMIIQLGAILSGAPERIIYNSATSAHQHEAMGYNSGRTTVIPNGFDIGRFQPDAALRCALRNSLGLSSQDWLIGVVGRAHPMKNHIAWLEAFYRIEKRISGVHTLIVGRGVIDSLSAKAERIGTGEQIHLMESVDHPETIYPALDLLVSPSRWGEGFSNVVGEAMACGVPAVVTKVGDSPLIVQDSGFVATDSTPYSLERAVIHTLSLGKKGLKRRGRLARSRIAEKFSTQIMIDKYQALWNGGDIFHS